MKQVWLLISALVHSSFGDFDSNVVRTYKSVLDDLAVSRECNASLTLLSDNIMSENEDTWAMRMLDATSKIPVGLLYSLNFGELGDFNECLATESEDGTIKAKYCLGSISLGSNIVGSIMSNTAQLQQQIHFRETAARMGNLQVRAGGASIVVSPTWAICLPSDCTDEDALNILSTLIGSQTAFCQTKEDLNPPLTRKAIVAIVILGIFAFLLVASTSYDLYCKIHHKVPPSALYVAFSVYSNGKKLFKTSKKSTELSCLNGIRFLSMLWVVIGHVFSSIMSFPLTNFKDLLDWFDTRGSMTIVSGTLSVDSFFVIGGALVVYVFMKARHNGAKFNILHFYLHRYLRLTPALAATVLVSATLLEYMGTGPKWPYIRNGYQETCQKYWWSTLLYVQNYVNVDSLCVAQTWYLSVDMQLYIISPLILLPLLKYTKIGLCLLMSCILAFIIVPFYVAYDKELAGIPTNFNAIANMAEYMEVYYYKTHTRAAPWFMGALLGYVLYYIEFKRNPDNGPLKINEVVVTLTWLICLALTITCVYAGFDTLRGPEYYRVANAFYIALIRPVWSLCLMWIIFACVSGHGAKIIKVYFFLLALQKLIIAMNDNNNRFTVFCPVNWFLSFPIYQVLNRFTYSLYLLHLTILGLIGYASKQGTYFSMFNMAYSFWGISMLSFGLSILWVLAFESPVIIIEKMIFKGTNKLMDVSRRLCRRRKGNTPLSSVAVSVSEEK